MWENILHVCELLVGRRFFSVLALCLVLPLSLSAASIKTWDGSASGYWTNGANWTGGTAPVSGDSLLFPVSATRYTTTNNFTNLTVATFSFDGSNYVHYGNAITNGGDITLNNTGGTNIIRFGLTLSAAQMFDVNGGATANLTVNSNLNLNGYDLTFDPGASGSIEVNGVISATGNLRKNSTGTLILSGASGNTYSGFFTMSSGTLLLNKSGSTVAINGAITNSGTIRYLQSYQIATVPVILNLGSTLDLNDKTDTIGSLTMAGATVDSGTGTLWLGGNLTNLASITTSTINGNLNLGSVTRTFDVPNGSASPDLRIYAAITGSGTAGIIKTGAGQLRLYGTNTYLGVTLINDGTVYADSDAAFGSPGAGVEVNNSAYLYLNAVNIGNASLTLNSTNSYPLYAAGASSWSGPVILDLDVQVYSYSGATMIFSNAISGGGNLSLMGNGDFEFAGTNGNYYTGVTYVKCSELRLNKTGTGTNTIAVSGDLVIGANGTGTSNVVLHVYGTDQIASTSDITINTNGVLNTAGHSDTISALTLNGGRVDTSTGTLTLGGDLTVNPPKRAFITGQLGLGSSTRVINVNATGDAGTDLEINAHVQNGGFVKTGTGVMNLLTSSSFTGTATISNGLVRAYHDTALGGTSGGTVVQPGAMLVVGANIGNEPLTLNSPALGYGACLQAFGACQWGGRVTLNADVAIDCDTSLTFTNAIVGSGGVKLTGGIFEYAGCVTNTYTGVTEVQCQMLRLNHTCGSSARAINGELVIGNGPGASNVVVLFDPDLINTSSNITLFTNGVLNLNNWEQQVGWNGGTLTMTGGRVDAGTGDFILQGNVIINGSPIPSRLSGTSLVLSGMRTFTFVTNGSMPALEVRGNLTLGGLNTVGNGSLYLYGSNSYTLPTILGHGPTYVYSSSPFGTTTNGTILTNSSYLYLAGVDVISEPLTNYSIAAYAMYASGTCSWSGPLILNNDTTLFAYNEGSLALSNAISGAGSLTLIGDTFEFAGSSANTYTGGTYAKSDLLLLGKTSGQNAVPPGDCFIGGGTGYSNVVQYLANNQIPVTADLTIQTNGVLNGNGFTDTIGNLIFNGGRVVNSGGTFTLTSGASVTVNPTNVMAALNGTLSLTTGDHIFSIGSGSASPDLSLAASVTGAGNIIYTGFGSVEVWGGTSTYTGLTTLGGPTVYLYSDTGLGSTAGGSIITNGSLYLVGVDIGNEALTNNRPVGSYALYASGNCSWSGPMVLNQDTRFRAYDTLVLSNAISGPGGLRLVGTTFEMAGNVTNTYAGTTEVQCNLLRLNHASATASANAIPADLIIGGAGTGVSNVVQHLANHQIASSSALTFHTNGVLNLNGFSDVAGSLTFNGGRVDDTGAGKLTINNGASITVNPTNQTARINCELGLNPGNHTVTVDAGPASPALQMNARVSGSGGLTYEGDGVTDLLGDNTYTGTTIINGGTLRADTDTSFGGTGSGTVCNGGQIMLMSVNIGAEPLTNNRPAISYVLVGSGACSWGGPMVLNSNALLYSYDTMTLSNVLSGPGGLQLDGATFELAGNVTNTYAGLTRVKCDLLRLNHSSASASANAIPGDMLIGGAGGASNVVKHLANYQIANAATLTFSSNAVLNANGFSDTIGGLVFTGGRIDNTGAGVLTLSSNLTVNAFDRIVEINGGLGLAAGNHAFVVGGGTAAPDLKINAILSGSGGFTASGGGEIDLRGNNTYSGPTALNGASVTLYTDTALGSTSGGTAINDGSLLSLQSVNVGNEALTNNCVSPACPLYAFGSSAWGGPVFLNTNLTVYSDDTLVFGNAIAGVGGLKLTGATVELAGTNANTYAGTTTVGSSFLRLNHAPGSNAIAGPLVVGLAGSVSNVVVWLQSSQVVDTVSVTLQTNAVLNLNNQGDVLDSLVFNGGRIDTGTGWVRPASSITVYPTNVEAVINGRMLLAGVVPFSIDDGTATYDLRINASIEDRSAGYHGGFNLTSPGMVLLNASNSFTGAIIIGAGRIYANHDYALGSGVAGTTVNDGAVLYVGSTANNVPEPITLNGHGSANNGALQVYGACNFLSNLVLNTDCTINGLSSAANTLSFSNAVSGNGGFTKIGTATMRLAGSSGNTYAGDTLLKQGTLLLAKSGGVVAVRNGSLTIGDGVGGAEADVVRYEAANQVHTDVAITVSSSGLLDLNGFNDSIGPLTLSASRVITGGGVATLAGNVTVTNGAASMEGKVSLLGVCVFTVSPASALGLAADVSGSGGLTKMGAGSIFLSGSNSFAGVTTINEGTLLTDTGYGLGATNNGTIVAAGADLRLRYGAQVGQEPLTLSGGGYSNLGVLSGIYGSNSWAGPITLAASARLATFQASDYLYLGGVIGGTGDVTVDGPGTVVMAAPSANTHSGNTIVTNGTLLMGNPGLVGAVPHDLMVGGHATNAPAAVARYLTNSQVASSITINRSGFLDLNGFTDVIADLNLNGGADMAMGAGSLTLNGDLNVDPLGLTNAVSDLPGRLAVASGTHSFNVFAAPANGSDPTELNLTAAVSGAGNIIKYGTGDLGLSASNSFTGALTVMAGEVRAYNSWAFGATNSGVTLNNNAVLCLVGPLAVGNEPLQVNSTGSAGAPPIYSTLGSNFWAGPVTLGANVRIGVTPTLGVLNLGGVIGGTGNLTKDDSGTLFFSGGEANNYAGTTYVNAGTLGLAKTVNNGAIPGALVVGDGVGGTNADVVQLPASGTGQIANTAAVTVNSSGLLDLTSFGSSLENVGSLAGSGRVNLAAAQLGVGLDGSSTLFSGTISGAGGSLIKSGAGIFTLTGTNTYTGETLANAGTLLLNGFQPASPVRIANNGTLAGTGIAGAISGGLGTLAPGASPGTLTCSNLCLSNNTVLTIELTGTNSDQLNVRGTNNLGGATLQVTTAGLSPTEGQTFIILNNDGTDGITNTFAGLPEGGIVSAGAYQFAVSYTGGTGNDVTLTYTNTAIQIASATISAGNGNGAVDANECDLLTVVLTNGSAYALSGATAALTPVTPGLAVTYPASAYPNVIPHGLGTNSETFQFTTWPGFAAFCGSNVQCQLTLNSTSHGSFTLPVTLPSGSPGVGVSYSWSGSQNILDGKATTNAIVVGGITAPLAKVTVSLYITHGADADLDLYLIGPDGTMVELSTDNGGSGTDYGTSCGVPTTFNDSAATPIVAGSAPFLGIFHPEGRLADFQGKAGAEVNGTWQLVAMDDTANGISGQLKCWTLTLYPAICTDGGGACESCPDRVISGAITTSSAVQNGRLARAGGASACGVYKATPALTTADPRYYDAYTFINGESNACINVALSAASAELFSVAYTNSYNPTALRTSYLADLGQAVSGGNTNSYSFNVAPYTVFVVVVHQIAATDFSNYSLAVTGGSCRPVLNSAPASGGNIVLDWTTAAVGYQLRQSLNVTNPVAGWSTSPTLPTVVNSHFTATNNSTTFGPQRFYQLRKP